MKKTRLTELQREGMLSETVYAEINARLDQDLASGEDKLAKPESLNKEQPATTGPA